MGPFQLRAECGYHLRGSNGLVPDYAGGYPGCNLERRTLVSGSAAKIDSQGSQNIEKILRRKVLGRQNGKFDLF